MRLSPGKRNMRTLMAGIMLVAFASRALIPSGFMPASGRPFSLEICWEGLPAELLTQLEPSDTESMGMDMDMPADSMAAEPGHAMSHGGVQQGPHHHSGSPSRSEHCVFGTAFSAGPITHLPLPSNFLPAQPLRAAVSESIALAVRVVHLPQPRAPPGQLSQTSNG
jgi:hypothetical protein